MFFSLNISFFIFISQRFLGFRFQSSFHSHGRNFYPTASQRLQGSVMPMEFTSRNADTTTTL
ncbi:hypothetical protein YC2023_081803 [Brassica napus]